MIIHDISKGAELTVREDEKRGPCFVKYRPLGPVKRRRASPSHDGTDKHPTQPSVAQSA